MIDSLLLWLSLYISSVEEVVVGRVLLSVRVKAGGIGGGVVLSVRVKAGGGGGESAVECMCES